MRLTQIDKLVLARGLTAAVRGYQLSLGWLFRGCCRFVPSCSSYALEAFAKHGGVMGLVLSVRRIARCHPFHRGGFDPVP